MPSWPVSGSPTGVPSASRHTRTVPSWLPLTMTGVPSGSAPTATADTSSVWPVSGSPTGVPSASRHTRTVSSSPPLTMTGVPSGSAPTATASTPRVAGQRLPDRGAVGQPPHPHRAVAAAADDDRGAVRQRPDRHRLPAGVAGEDLVTGSPATVGPAGLPRPVGGGARDTGGQAAEAELVGGQFKLAGPRRLVEAGEAVGALPVHGGGGPRLGGSCGVEVGHQPGRIDGEPVVRILEQAVEPSGRGGMRRQMPAYIGGRMCPIRSGGACGHGPHQDLHELTLPLGFLLLRAQVLDQRLVKDPVRRLAALAAGLDEEPAALPSSHARSPVP